MDEGNNPKKAIPELEISDTHRERISRLTPSEVARIDNWLMSFASRRGRKVAFLVLSAMSELKSDIVGVPDVFYLRRVEKLVDEGRLVISLGDLAKWEDCEVLLAHGDIEWK